MGVVGLWRIVAPAEERRALDALAGEAVAVDLAVWLCGDMTVRYNSAVTLKLYVRNLFFRITNLLHRDILPIGVCDGAAPQLKLREMERRQGQKTSTARTHFRRIARQCCVLLEGMGVPFLESPGEAEAMCARLNAAGLVSGCLTSDGDAFLYGAEEVFSALSLARTDAHVSAYRAARIRSQLGLDRARLVLLALLLGCDLTGGEGVPGVGPKLALRWATALSGDVDLMGLLRCWGEAGAAAMVDAARKEDRAVLHLLEERLAGREEAVRAVAAEFAGNDAWPLPEAAWSWARPQPQRVVEYCRRHLDWEESYTRDKLLPLVACWDMQHPRLPASPSLHPLRALRRRRVQFVPCIEVEWRRWDFDAWGEGPYVFAVPEFPFAEVHAGLVAAMDAARTRTRAKGRGKGKGMPKASQGSAEEQQLALALAAVHLTPLLAGAFHTRASTPSAHPDACRLRCSLVSTPGEPPAVSPPDPRTLVSPGEPPAVSPLDPRTLVSPGEPPAVSPPDPRTLVSPGEPPAVSPHDPRTLVSPPYPSAHNAFDAVDTPPALMERLASRM